MKKIKVKNLSNKTRLDIYLTKALNQKRSHVNKLIENKLIRVNGRLPIKKGELIDNDFIIQVNTLIQKENQLKSFHQRIKIIYEDNDLIVVDKPKKLIVHPTSFQEQNTLINALIHKICINDFDDPLRPGIIHRLDRNTTGLIVIAKNKKTYDNLIQQMKNKTLIRKYLAIVHNNIENDFLLINAPIHRSKQNLLKMTVSSETKAKPAQTEIKLLENYHNAALIECHLLTGRTHQIRVHLAYIRHPIYNDDLYGNYDGYEEYGQFLHAYYLSFVHPTNKQIMEFKSQPDNIFLSLQKKLRSQT
ncbi:MAG: RluA family pseudouridine synthase [Mycoplasmataceae bacterium]|nr:RluA family pseudouridine synthase [Mycoplasmataceae bacterium]